MRLTGNKLYTVVQTPERTSAWKHYFCGFFGAIPRWIADPAEALRVDEQTARDLVKRFDDRYRRVVTHLIEDVP